MERIKVLQVIGTLRIGGAETVAMNLYRFIDRERFEFHYLVYGDSVGDYEDEVKALGGLVIHTKCSIREKINFSHVLKQIYKMYGPYEIVHVHMMFHNGVVLSAAKKVGIPVRISHAHSTNGGGENRGCNRIIHAIYSLYERWLINRTANILISCGNDAGVFLYGKRAFDKRCIVIKNGIDVSKYKFDTRLRNIYRKKYNLSGKIVFGCVGHFEKVKNHAFLIDVFSEFCMQERASELVLLGDGILRSTIENQCLELKIKDKVLIMGNVNDVGNWMNAFDCLLMPSIFEGMPLALIEAQASGLKCIVSQNISAEIDITGHVGFLPLDKKNWIEEMKKCSIGERFESDEMRIKESGYSVERNVKELEEIYIHTINEGMNKI
uniref:Glycosyltransferase n=1 Tax=Eubacterium cellulosolvens (strain ATCC 43171 / JCM 9499 / 6) TaxID=633697 RepID=I5AQ98_EUBC6